jgi:NTP pyrophosphatase (non-canonical NTP hydrolase)
MHRASYETFVAQTRVTGDLDMVRYGLIGELGELTEHLKKARFHGKPVDKGALMLELGDLYWYATAGLLWAREAGYEVENASPVEGDQVLQLAQAVGRLATTDDVADELSAIFAALGALADEYGFVLSEVLAENMLKIITRRNSK